MSKHGWVAFGLGLFACGRPVDLPTSGSTLISDVLVEPHYVKEEVDLAISFQIAGVFPERVSYDVGGKRFDCAPEAAAGGRLRCTHPGLTKADFPPGNLLVVVEARDENGQVSLSADQIVVDFDCPRVVSLGVSRGIAAPGDNVTLTIEATEGLRKPPRVTRGGRDWDPVVGEGRSWSVSRTIGAEDPSNAGPLVVQLEDLAGNTSGDCAADGTTDFLVDQSPPLISVEGLMLVRDAPGTTSSILAMPNVFTDDTGIEEVRVHDETGVGLLATVRPMPDGSLPPTALGVETRTRVKVVAVDRFGRTSEPATIPERWRLTIGGGASPGSALRTGTRWTPAGPDSTSMENRTFELAPDVLNEDARAAVVRSRIGYVKVGQLPARYEGVNRIMAGYEPVGKSIVAAGGYAGTDYNTFALYVADVLLLQWDEREAQYVLEQGPSLSYTDPLAPFPRYNTNMAFDGQGCGVLYAGDAREAEFDARLQGDVWELCLGATGYEWARIDVPDVLNGLSLRNIAPMVYDRANGRYVVGGGTEGYDPRVAFLEPGPDADSWSWFQLTPLPTNFSDRFGNFLYYDPARAALVLGSGSVSGGTALARLAWTYRGGQWSSANIPYEITYNTGHGFAYDEARRQLVFWGGSDSVMVPPRPETWFLTDSATVGETAWRSTQIDHPINRIFPSMVYDADREAVIMFGGARTDNLPVPPDVYQIIAQPSLPYLQASIDLAARRPKGIAKLSLKIRASGVGDADGVRPGTARAGGYSVLLWDHRSNRWDTAARSATTVLGFETIEIDVLDDPERYVSTEGRVPLSLVPNRPATEAVDGRLDVDLIEGHLELRPGVTLP